MYSREVISFRGRSKRSMEACQTTEKLLIDCLGDIDICAMTFEDVTKWHEYLCQSRSVNTVSNYIVILRGLLKHLKLRGINVLNYEIVAVPKRVEVPVDYLSPEEVSELINAMFTPHRGMKRVNRYRNRAIVSTLYASGIRVSELCSLDIASIREDGSFTVQGKGNKIRLCYLDTRAQQHIREYLAVRTDTNCALFISHQNDRRITKCVVEIVFRHAKERMGMKKALHPHVLRHSYATNLLKNNANLYYVSKFLGHSNVATTQRYLHYVDADLKKAYAEHHTM